LFLACTDRVCEKVECGPFGVCIEDYCECDPGYELDLSEQCRIRSADRYAGNYLVTTTGNAPGCPDQPYVATLTPSATHPDRLELRNLGAYSCLNGDDLLAEATVDRDELTLLPGPYCERFTLSGQGRLRDSVLTLNYTASYTIAGSVIQESCSATLVRD